MLLLVLPAVNRACSMQRRQLLELTVNKASLAFACSIAAASGKATGALSLSLLALLSEACRVFVALHRTLDRNDGNVVLLRLCILREHDSEAWPACIACMIAAADPEPVAAAMQLAAAAAQFLCLLLLRLIKMRNSLRIVSSDHSCSKLDGQHGL